MLKEDDRIAVAVSGGKDSLCMLHILHSIEQKFPKSELIVVTVDEGIRNYREEALEIAKESARKLNLEHFIVSFRELYGKTLDELVHELSLNTSKKMTACAYCGVLRRRALNHAALEVKADKLAVAHNLDDEAQTTLLNLIRCDVPRLLRTGPVVPSAHEKFVTRIKPLRDISEKETTLYVYFRNIPLHTLPCPYAQYALRNDVRNFLNEMERKHPEIKYNILKSADQIREIAGDKTRKKLLSCELCGAPSSSRICKTCQILAQISNPTDS